MKKDVDILIKLNDDIHELRRHMTLEMIHIEKLILELDKLQARVLELRLKE